MKQKGSLFIGHLAHAPHRESAEEFVAELRSCFHDATHNCFAYRMDESVFRYSDDGEPPGTAGKPILSTIDKFHLIKVVLVVTRYFGGTKLGTGGLIRAYSGCAEITIKNAEIQKHYNFKIIEAEYPFEVISQVHHVVNRYTGAIREDATPDGMLSRIEVLPSRIEKLKAELRTATSGRIVFTEK
ncbi:MAG: YigZ family protein [Calditrichaeota bacterium]|nr:YigZ family protein [Calditrichota bacterium]